MSPADFTKEKNSRLIKTQRDYWAFLPNPLPPQLTLSWDLVNQLSETDRTLSELAGTARTLPNPHLLIGPFIRREAILSSRIEGTQAALSDLLFFEASGSVDPSPGRSGGGQLCESDGIRIGASKKVSAQPPLYQRSARASHARRSRRTSYTRRISPLPELDWARPLHTDERHLRSTSGRRNGRSLGLFEGYLHAPSTVPLLIRLAAIHYQFEAIHPFLDGNGRIGRLLITLLLCKEGALPEPLLYLSAYFERYRNDYYRLLLAVSQSGKWIDWISFFLRGVAEQSRDALVRSDRLLQLWKNYRGEFQSARSSALQLRLVDQLFAYPAITANQAAKLLQVTHRSAQLNIEKLIRKGILKEATGKQRNRVFIAPHIVKIIEATHAS